MSHFDLQGIILAHLIILEVELEELEVDVIISRNFNLPYTLPLFGVGTRVVRTLNRSADAFDGASTT